MSCSYQQMLHRNLVYLATIADSNQNMQSLLPAVSIYSQFPIWHGLNGFSYGILKWLRTNIYLFCIVDVCCGTAPVWTEFEVGVSLCLSIATHSEHGHESERSDSAAPPRSQYAVRRAARGTHAEPDERTDARYIQTSALTVKLQQLRKTLAASPNCLGKTTCKLQYCAQIQTCCK